MTKLLKKEGQFYKNMAVYTAAVLLIILIFINNYYIL